MYLLGIDVGTSSVKCVLIRDDASIVAEAAAEVDIYSPAPLFSEQKPSDWWDATLTALGRLDGSEEWLKRVDAVAMCGQQHGLVALDADGRVLRDAILWNDLRTVAQCREMMETLGGVDALVAHTNNGVTPGFTAPKLLWMRENEPQRFARIRSFVLPKDYIAYRLTGNIATDVTDASGTGLFDVRDQRWAKDTIVKLGLDLDIFPRVVQSFQQVGTVGSVSEQCGLCRGVPVFAGAGDGVCQSAGMGVVSAEALGVVIGTSGVVSAVQRDFSVNRGGKLQYFCNCERDTWMSIGCQLNSGASVQWANQNIIQGDRRFARFNQLAAQAEAACGVFYLPYIGGERCPHDNAEAKGVYFGLDSGSGLPEIARATMEGVTYGLKQIYDLTCACNEHFHPEYVVTSGGASKSPLWRQILADIFDMPVYTPPGAEGGGAYGAAILAGVGMQVWPSMADAVAIRGLGDCTQPGSDVQRYRAMAPVFTELYEALVPSYHKLAQIKEKMQSEEKTKGV